MDTENLDKLKKVQADLHKRVQSNRPFNTEELVNVLVIIADSLIQVMEPVKNPAEPATEQRRL